uniref:Uncharacterized protein n=1 Tax=Lepeophtheirus salmonis TaxID=72036 RepID=A0A0K2V0S6_LEPSM
MLILNSILNPTRTYTNIPRQTITDAHRFYRKLTRGYLYLDGISSMIKNKDSSF